MEANEEVNKVFSLLSERVVRSKKKDSKKLTQQKYRWDAIAPTSLMKLFLIGVVFFFVLACVAAITNQTTIVYDKAIPSKAIYLLSAFCFFTLFEVLWCIRLIKHLKSPHKQIDEDFNRAKDEAVAIEWQIIEDIVKEVNFEKYVLEYVENKINYLIEEIQDRAKINYTFIKILAFLIVAAIIYIWFPYGALIKIIASSDIKVWSGVLALFSAVVAGIILTLQFVFELMLQFQLSKLKKCLYLLEQAKSRVNNVKDRKKLVQSERSGTKQSLMSKLKNIKIDGPEDFATNLDLYLSGDKRIEPDIR